MNFNLRWQIICNLFTTELNPREEGTAFRASATTAFLTQLRPQSTPSSASAADRLKLSNFSSVRFYREEKEWIEVLRGTRACRAELWCRPCRGPSVSRSPAKISAKSRNLVDNKGHRARVTPVAAAADRKTAYFLLRPTPTWNHHLRRRILELGPAQMARRGREGGKQENFVGKRVKCVAGVTRRRQDSGGRPESKKACAQFHAAAAAGGRWAVIVNMISDAAPRSSFVFFRRPQRHRQGSDP